MDGIVMQKITQADYRIMPWKNGQGSTTELLVEPAGPGLDDFDWRISCATIQADGDFSNFRGVDRSLLILSGDGVNLNFNQQVTLTLTPQSQALSFVGEDDVQAGLLDGAVTDFNVMTRRSRWLHDLEKHTFERTLTLQMQADVSLIYHAGGGDVQFMIDDAHFPLSQNELLRIESDAIEFKSEGQATLYVVYLNRRT